MPNYECFSFCPFKNMPKIIHQKPVALSAAYLIASVYNTKRQKSVNPTCPRRLVRAVWCQLYCWFKSLLTFSNSGIWHNFRYLNLTEDQLAVIFMYRLNYWTSTTWELSCEILSNYWLECFEKSWGILTYYKQVFYQSKYCILRGAFGQK